MSRSYPRTDKLVAVEAWFASKDLNEVSNRDYILFHGRELKLQKFTAAETRRLCILL